jgi:hypothetical protein
MRRRQRISSTGLAVLMLLAASACEAGPSVQAAQTAVVAAQTALPAAQGTAQAAATTVSVAVANAQPIVATLQGLLAGAAVQIKTTPDGADPASATGVDVEGTDAQGRLAQVDERTRQAAVSAALLAASQYFPKATITVKVDDASGATIVSGSVSPGQQPTVQ